MKPHLSELQFLKLSNIGTMILAPLTRTLHSLSYKTQLILPPTHTSALPAFHKMMTMTMLGILPLFLVGGQPPVEVKYPATFNMWTSMSSPMMCAWTIMVMDKDKSQTRCCVPMYRVEG